VDDSISLADDDEELVDPDPYRDVGLVGEQSLPPLLLPV
jgi:hypothetical protein